MLTIYHSPGTRGFRLIWLCEELSLEYQLQLIDFSPQYRETPEWRALNPVGKVPVLRDGELVMFESGAMLQYVLERYAQGRLIPDRDSDDYALFLQWCWFAEATFGRATGEIANHKRGFKPVLDDVVAEMQARARLCLQALGDALSKRPYLLGNEFSAADIMMGYTLQSFTRHVSDDYGEVVNAYWQRLSSRDAFRAALDAEKK